MRASGSEGGSGEVAPNSSSGEGEAHGSDPEQEDADDFATPPGVRGGVSHASRLLPPLLLPAAAVVWPTLDVLHVFCQLLCPKRAGVANWPGN